MPTNEGSDYLVVFDTGLELFVYRTITIIARRAESGTHQSQQTRGLLALAEHTLSQNRLTVYLHF